MSYNITTWKTKSMNGLVIPVSAIKDLPYVVVDVDDHNVFFAGGTCEMFDISGAMHGNSVCVEKLEYSGEGSGHEWDAFKRMLSQSMGELIASQVWEGGDSITRLIVKDGSVTEENVEI